MPFHLLLIIEFILLAAPFLPSRIERCTYNVYTLKLVGGCCVDYHVPIQSVGLACPGVDYIRLWPLPMVQPWPDLTDWPEGWYVESLPNVAGFASIRIGAKPLKVRGKCDKMNAA